MEENKNEKSLVENENNTSSDEKEESKKGFKAWFNKTKGDVNNYLLENKIENTFNKTNIEFSLGTYNPEAIISTQKQIFGYFDNDGKLVVFGDKEIAPFSIIVDNKTNIPYTVVSKDALTSVQIEVEGVKYVRPGTKFNINNHVQEVRIIKVAGKTYLYEGE